MKKLLSCLLALAMLVSLCAISGANVFAAGGTIYYVDPSNGSDDNDGKSENSAWATLWAHSDFDFEPGDSILLKRGEAFTGTFFPASEGTSAAPITIGAYGDESDGAPLMLSFKHQPTIFLLNISGWVVDGLEFSSLTKDGAGIRIEAINGRDRSVYDFSTPPEDPYDTADFEDDDEADDDDDEPSPSFDFKEFFEGIGHDFEESWQEIKENVEWFLGLEKKEYDLSAWEGLPDDYVISDIAVKNCVFHDLSFYKASDITSGCKPITVNASGKGSKFENVTISGCEIYDCAYGVEIDGLSAEFDPEFFISEKESYNRNIAIEDVTVRHTGYGAILLGAVEGGIVKNCLTQDTCLYDDWFTAPLWTHHCDNVVIENCEVAGSKNWKDGMTVDFDGWTQNTTYQYIYSHDNVCFMKSNNYDNTTQNRNNTVRYCLSVNDNKLINIAALFNMSHRYPYADHGRLMENFKFYNNTIVNAAPTLWGLVKNSTIANNIFVGNKNGLSSIQLTIAKNTRIKNNCFYGMSPMPGATKSLLCDPGFVSDAEDEKGSFMLSSSSKLLGKGIQAEEDMGQFDFYGNELGSTHSIGCYDGAGEDAKSNSSSRAFTFFGRFILWIKAIIAKIFG